MPNWCSNDLIVTGKQKALDKFKASVCSERIEYEHVVKLPLDFNRVLPMPADPKEQLKQSEGTWPAVMEQQLRESMGLKGPKEEEARLRDAWHTWHVSHWGTKWNLCDDTQVTEEPGKLSYYFDTAWSPPELVVAAMAEQHPKLVFLHRYWELGNDFAGWSEYRGGECVDHQEGTPDKFDFVPQIEPEYILCSICGKDCAENTAHRHQDKWIGDECCWDERLRASE